LEPIKKPMPFIF